MNYGVRWLELYVAIACQSASSSGYGLRLMSQQTLAFRRVTTAHPQIHWQFGCVRALGCPPSGLARIAGSCPCRLRSARQRPTSGLLAHAPALLCGPPGRPERHVWLHPYDQVRRPNQLSSSSSRPAINARRPYAPTVQKTRPPVGVGGRSSVRPSKPACQSRIRAENCASYKVLQNRGENRAFCNSF